MNTLPQIIQTSERSSQESLPVCLTPEFLLFPRTPRCFHCSWLVIYLFYFSVVPGVVSVIRASTL